MPKKKTGDRGLKTEELVTKNQELVSDLQRLQADFINYKARAEKDKTDALKLGREMAVTELLPIFDNLERAFSHTPEELKENNWVKGINGLEKQLVSVMGDLGLRRIETIGKPFDPITMEAVSVEDGDGNNEEIVSEELQAGYMLGDRIVRPAMVKVSK